MTNDHLKSGAVFVAAWLLVWAVLTGTVLAQGGTSKEVSTLSALLTTTAVMSAVGIMVFDRAPRLARLLILLVLVLTAAVINMHIAAKGGLGGGFVQELVNAVTVLGIVIAIQQGARSLMHQRRAQRAEQARKAAEQRALNARLSPHVLYNMLNAIYAASLKDPARSSELILSLASMIRYLTESGDRDSAPAGQELAFIIDQAELVRARSGELDVILLDFPVRSEIEVPTLLCATLFENAVTHGKTSGGRVDIAATFRETRTGFTFLITNSFDPSPQAPRAGLGTGVAAIRDRLAFLYPGRHRFEAGASMHGVYKAEIEVW